ncbi:flagellar brake protein [Desertibacillus haloalkaliphilus]|uniref:flagellar brake protein n=1 Tax=Desertibacillus haloalkaliphilus TaxID=1328930 RepID=UPI001C26B188|nr:flagellar brake domain-containing protein [Desertibacillus haloalkaliphilus]MBU8907222.1 flagellar brake domain-containing protein [Desertibacillus haloalkaliphilus]
MIAIGDTIFLDLKEDGKRFKCRLVDQIHDIFVIDIPINEKTNKPGFFYDGTQFVAWFIGSDQAVYSFDTEIRGRKKGNIPMLLLKNPGKENYLRIQRRNYVRVETSIDVAVHPFKHEFPPFVTTSLDLSGGGIAILLPKNHTVKAGTNIHCLLVLHMQSGDIHYIKTECRVIRIIEQHALRERASLQFINISDHDRQKAIRYCFERQLFLKHKKGL